MSVRVLIVDDSTTIRRLIAATLNGDRDVEVVGEAADPNEARAAIKELNPDVITLDVEMPNMNGLDFFERLMRLGPIPVVMVSTLIQTDSAVTIRALATGAVEYVAKPSPADPDSFADLCEKVKIAARAAVQRSRPAPPLKTEAMFRPNGNVVSIGASTGGVEALIMVLSPTVGEAVAGEVLQPGRIYLAPGGSHLEIDGIGAPRCRLTTADNVNGHRPSVDVLFHSVTRVMRKRAVGAILTGMGSDGADGLLAMRQAGAIHSAKTRRAVLSPACHAQRSLAAP